MLYGASAGFAVVVVILAAVLSRSNQRSRLQATRDAIASAMDEEYDLEFETDPELAYPSQMKMKSSTHGRSNVTSKLPHPARLSVRGQSKESITSWETEYADVSAVLSQGGEYIGVEPASPLTWDVDDIHVNFHTNYTDYVRIDPKMTLALGNALEAHKFDRIETMPSTHVGSDNDHSESSLSEEPEVAKDLTGVDHTIPAAHVQGQGRFRSGSIATIFLPDHIPSSPDTIKAMIGLGTSQGFNRKGELILEDADKLESESVADTDISEFTVNEVNCPDLFVGVPEIMSPTPVKAAQLYDDSNLSSPSTTAISREPEVVQLNRERAVAALRNLAKGRDGCYLFRQDGPNQTMFLTYSSGDKVHHVPVILRFRIDLLSDRLDRPPDSFHYFPRIAY